MAKTADKWSLEKAYPPMRATEYTALAKKVVAEWMQMAHVSCAEDYHLSAITEQVARVVIADMQAVAASRRLPIGDLITPAEDE